MGTVIPNVMIVNIIVIKKFALKIIKIKQWYQVNVFILAIQNHLNVINLNKRNTNSKDSHLRVFFLFDSFIPKIYLTYALGHMSGLRIDLLITFFCTQFKRFKLK